MKPWRGSVRAVAALVLGSAAVPFLAPAASASTASVAVCGSSSHPTLAAKLTRDIQAAQRGRLDIPVWPRAWDGRTTRTPPRRATHLHQQEGDGRRSQHERTESRASSPSSSQPCDWRGSE